MACFTLPNDLVTTDFLQKSNDAHQKGLSDLKKTVEQLQQDHSKLKEHVSNLNSHLTELVDLKVQQLEEHISKVHQEV
jgi:peptidoglycan hydrolase CwlO-like protein